MKSSKKTGANKTALKKTVLSRGVDQIVDRKHLEKLLGSGRKLRVKFGIDATAPDLHLGNAVVLRKLKQFQDLGHKVVLIIGDFTTKVGDPSLQSKDRKALTDKEIRANMRNYLTQAGKVIDIKKAEVRYNSEWLGKSVENLLELARAATLNQVSERADFQERIKKGQKVTFQEAFYSLLQGFDSVNIKADVELGGSDQLLNLLMGRQVQRYYGQTEQDILTVPLLEGTDGVRKMSKSYNNYIGLDDKPNDMYGKIMSIPDKLIFKYLELGTGVSLKEITSLKKKKPRDAKARLAYEIVKLYHDEEEAGNAEAEFNKVFQQKKLPTRVPVKNVKKQNVVLDELIVTIGAAKSKSEARRLVTQGAVRLDYAHVEDPKEKIKIPKNGILLQVGKRKFVRVKKN